MYFLLLIFIFENNDTENSQLIKKIFIENNKNLYNYLLIKTNGNRGLSEEIFSETFLTTIVNLPKLKNIKNIKAWLFVVAKNKLINHIKKTEKERNYINNNKKNIDDNSDVIDDLEKKQEKLLVNMAMSNLKEIYRNILLMKYSEDKSQKEIAEVLNKSRSAVESMLDRARKALKKEINKLLKDF